MKKSFESCILLAVPVLSKNTSITNNIEPYKFLNFTVWSVVLFFMLNGCTGGSGSSGSNLYNVGSTQNKAAGNNLSGYTTAITSFSLYGQRDDANTAIAGEIDGNQITIQLPAETSFPATFTVVFHGVSSLQTESGAIVTSDKSTQTFTFLNQDVVYYALKDGVLQPYTVSVTKGTSYYAKYAEGCIKDIDGSMWSSTPTEDPFAYWGTAYAFTKAYTGPQSSKDCKFPMGSWDLPSKAQFQTMISQYNASPKKSTTYGIYDWLSDQNFKVVSGGRYWSSSTDEADSSKRYGLLLDYPVMQTFSVYQFPEVFSVWPVHTGDGSDAKTITDFSMSQQIGDTVILGNQIFATGNVLGNSKGDVAEATFNFTTTGYSTITINGKKYTNGVPIILPDPSSVSEQIIPITVTSKNGDKNIYTLVLTIKPILPTPPVEPKSLYLCTSSDSTDMPAKFNRKVFATIGPNGEYRITLPEPGHCSSFNFFVDAHPIHSISPEDLKGTIFWWSTTDTSPLIITKYFDADGDFSLVIPTFTWVPDSTKLSGYTLTSEVRKGCTVSSANSQLEFSPACTLAENTPIKTIADSNSESISIRLCSISTHDDKTVTNIINDFVQDATNDSKPDPNTFILVAQDYYKLSDWNTLPKIASDNLDESCKNIELSVDSADLIKYVYLSGDAYSPLTMRFNECHIYSNDVAGPIIAPPGGQCYYSYRADDDPPPQGIPLNMIAETKYCHWTLDWDALSKPMFGQPITWQTSLTIQQSCAFPYSN
ncbi:MAG TPA: hypothetical protein VKR58_01810 [Aquella sp.]|nr:hypothetical protein [Aquella sp.]